MTPREKELLTGMGNCYAACSADFAETVEMVAGSRRLSPEQVVATLKHLGTSEGQSPEYRTLRARLPESFPF
jgi:hypothetical protein